MTQRGLQFSKTAVAELLQALASAKVKLQSIEHNGNAEFESLSKSELTAMRKQILELQSDLRAELRRRNEI